VGKDTVVVFCSKVKAHVRVLPFDSKRGKEDTNVEEVRAGRGVIVLAWERGACV
jgi:hypothetical protein